MIRNRAKTALLLLSLLQAAAGTARAGQIEVSPVTLDLPAGSSSTVLTVANRGSERSAIQLRGFRWAQSPRDDSLVPTAALVISPPIFELNPGERQVVRVLLREKPHDREASYRLILDELPAATTPSAIRLALRLSLPLFAAPVDRIAPDLRWRVIAAADGVMLDAVNAGTKRERVTGMAVRLGGTTLHAQALGNAWVLPGAERRWMLPGASRPRGGSAQLRAQSDSGAVDAPIPVDGAP